MNTQIYTIDWKKKVHIKKQARLAMTQKNIKEYNKLQINYIN